MTLKIGTSGWSYKEWEKIFYPDSKTPKLSYYSKIFKTAEIDSTFYANPKRGLVFGWAKNTPKNFQFSVKLPQLITHRKKLDLGLGVEVDLNDFVGLLQPLSETDKLGPLLIQLPPSFSFDKVDTLEKFCEVLPKGYKFAVEFRNESWLEDAKQVRSLLAKYDVSNTIVDEPLLPVDLNVTTKEFAFVRWHGRGEKLWYNYKYSEEEVKPWVARVKEISSKVKTTYGYWNNHFSAFAIE
ncbi:MAG TPA: DUF72 domain-containing protein, partial [Nitrososphaerales archaeon]|nr:DUF72 domain-containing protein [Nitrososphaerales archaeon]